MNRRKMFGFIAASPVACVGTAAAMADEEDAPESEIMRLTHGPQWERMRLLPPADGEAARSIGLAVGRDGLLWVKVGDDWRRVSVV